MITNPITRPITNPIGSSLADSTGSVVGKQTSAYWPDKTGFIQATIGPVAYPFEIQAEHYAETTDNTTVIGVATAGGTKYACIATNGLQTYRVSRRNTTLVATNVNVGVNITNQWRTVRVVFLNNTDFDIYVDGALTSRSGLTSVVPDWNLATVGTAKQTGEFQFQGWIKNASVTTAGGVQVYLPLATDANDTSGNGNDGTITPVVNFTQVP